MDGIERAHDMFLLHVPITQHRRPAEDGVQRRAQLVRERGKEFVFEPIGGFGLYARVGERFEQIAQLVLAIAAAHRASNERQRGTKPDRTLEKDDVPQPFEQAQRAEVNLRPLGVGKQQNRDVRPRRLRAKAFHELADACVLRGLLQ